ncbi:MAG: mechanosensitive ion channel family protein [Chloroflexota bacterium]|nr:mechanosensitive ion channel family protein [Chloroflexota bacterium]
MRDDLTHAARDLGRYVLSFLGEVGEFVIGVVLFVGIIWGVALVGGRFRRWFLDRALSRWGSNPNLPSLVDNLLRVLLFVVGLLLALGAVGASTNSLVTWVGVIIAALSLALQDVIKNLVAGFYLLIEQPFRTGDRLAIGDSDGYVVRVNLRTTALRNQRRQLVLVPNYLVFSQVVTNRSAYEPHCLDITIESMAVAPGEIRTAIASTVTSILGDSARDPEVDLMSLGEESSTVRARIWLKERAGQRDRVLLALHEQFPAATIIVSEG